MEQDIYLSIEDHCDPAFVICSSIFLILFFPFLQSEKKRCLKNEISHIYPEYQKADRKPSKMAPDSRLGKEWYRNARSIFRYP